MSASKFFNFVNYVSIFFDRVGLWFLIGDSLAHYVCTGTIEGCEKVSVGLLDVSKEALFTRAASFGIKLNTIYDDHFSFERNGYDVEILLFNIHRKQTVINTGTNTILNLSWIVADNDNLDSLRRKRVSMSNKGVWRRKIDLSRYQVNLPYWYGTILDETVPDWYRMYPKRPYPTTGEIFFTEERKENGRKLISGIYNAGEKAGIADRIFAGFGTCLGYLMYGDYVAKDRDMDMCILSDGMTPEQYKTYSDACYHVDVVKPSRWEISKRNDNEYYWFSVGYKNPVADYGCKSCNWFMFSWDKLLIHSKGGRWVNTRKINASAGYSKEDEAVGLAQPIHTIPKLVTVDFNGVKMQIPSKPGSCCDWWYPGWCPEGDGASAHNVIVIIPKYSDRNTWRVV